MVLCLFFYQVNLGYPSGDKTVDVVSPWRRKNVKRVVRQNYASLSSSVATSPRTSNLVISNICRVIHKEMKDICSHSHDSILCDSHDGLKQFSWETVFTELKEKTPALIKVLAALLPNHKERKGTICLIASMILKNRLAKMSIVQRAISVPLYGNGCSKQVYYMHIFTF